VLTKWKRKKLEQKIHLHSNKRRLHKNDQEVPKIGDSDGKNMIEIANNIANVSQNVH
jgi:hypothetical protein